MRHGPASLTQLGALALPLLLFLGAPALASEGSSEPTRVAEILSHVDGIDAEKLSPFADFYLAKKRGLGYKRSLTVGERSLVLKLEGPFQRRQSIGLGFQLKF